MVTLGPEVLQDHIEKVQIIRQCLRVTQDRQRRYADPKLRAVKFQVGEFAYLRVSPRKGHRRFGFNGKNEPRYTGSFEVTERLGRLHTGWDCLRSLLECTMSSTCR